MKGIGIVGAGVAGLQLALTLQHRGIPATLYAERSPAQIRTGRLPSLVVRFEATRERERALGVDHWGAAQGAVLGVQMYAAAGESALDWRGWFARPASAVDMRIYQAALLEDFERRGGEVVLGALGASDVAELAAGHELVVVAAGRAPLAELFPRDPQRSPYAAPQRRLIGGFFRGLELPDPLRVIYVLCPGLGEIFQAPFHSFGGLVSSLLIEAIPGQAFEPITRLRPADDPEAFSAALLALLREHAPPIHAQVRPHEFGLARPLDVLEGAIAPTVRRGYAELAPGRFALALGDVHILNDPLAAQGANTASRCAALLGEALACRPRLDEAFCRDAEQQLWRAARAATEWTNASLAPPPPHVLAVFQAAARSQPAADQLVENFGAPERNWEIFGSPEGAAAFLAHHGLA